MLKLLLVMLGIVVVAVVSVRLAVSFLRFVRKHRGEASEALAFGLVRSWVADGLEHWVDEGSGPDSHGFETGDNGLDQHGHHHGD